jgi:ribosome biogenesis GTPase A
MVTARKEAAAAMRKTDVVIEVLDARVPHASVNPIVEALRVDTKRPALKILNKADLADPDLTKRWLAHYAAQPETRAIALSANRPREASRIPKECLALRPEIAKRSTPLRMMILGIPNVGKSTLMNALLHRRIAKVGDEPAITKMHMEHRLDNGMWLVDTPGMLWPGVLQATALKLCATHSIGRAAYDDEEVAVHLGRYLLRRYRPLVEARYDGAPDPGDGPDLLAWIARRRSFVARGGAPDLARAATALLNDFRDGALGRVTLETPEDPPDTW